MQDGIGDVIAKGLSVVYKEKPKNPIDFFSKWLLNEHSLRKTMNQEKLKDGQIQKMKDKQTYKIKEEKKAAEERQREKSLLDKVSIICKKLFHNP